MSLEVTSPIFSPCAYGSYCTGRVTGFRLMQFSVAGIRPSFRDHMLECLPNIDNAAPFTSSD